MWSISSARLNSFPTFYDRTGNNGGDSLSRSTAKPCKSDIRSPAVSSTNNSRRRPCKDVYKVSDDVLISKNNIDFREKINKSELTCNNKNTQEALWASQALVRHPRATNILNIIYNIVLGRSTQAQKWYFSALEDFYSLILCSKTKVKNKITMPIYEYNIILFTGWNVAWQINKFILLLIKHIAAVTK